MTDITNPEAEGGQGGGYGRQQGGEGKLRLYSSSHTALTLTQATAVVPPAEVAGAVEAAVDSNPTAAAAVAEATAAVSRVATPAAAARTPTRVAAVATRAAHNSCAQFDSLLKIGVLGRRFS